MGRGPGSSEEVWQRSTNVIAIYMCMEAALGISLCSCLYLKLAKCYIFLITSYDFSSTKSENKRMEQVLPGSRGRWMAGVGDVAQTMYMHVSKCKNDKIK
jgi:hypothetical protein